MSRTYPEDPRRAAEGARTQESLQQGAESAGAAAGRVAGEARAGMESAAETGKKEAAGRLENIVSALHASADDLGRKDDRLGDAVRGVADQVQSAAQHLRDQDLGGLAREISDFARRNPAAFLAGAAVLGFAVSRLASVTATQGGRERYRGGMVEGGGYGVP